MNRTMGTLKVDFAGTRVEAAAFAKQHTGLHVGNGRNIGNEGLPQLTVRYQSPEQRRMFMERLAELGWDSGSVTTVPATGPRRSPYAPPPAGYR